MPSGQIVTPAERRAAALAAVADALADVFLHFQAKRRAAGPCPKRGESFSCAYVGETARPVAPVQPTPQPEESKP